LIQSAKAARSLLVWVVDFTPVSRGLRPQPVVRQPQLAADRQRELYLELREPGFAPAPLLEHLVTAGYLGRKTGRGFRDYTNR
jgi:hypothetical protein